MLHPRQAHRASFLGDELRRDARAVAPGDADLLPRSFALPLLPEPTALTERRTQSDEPSLRHGQHGPHTAIQVVGNARGFIEYQQIDATERADGLLASGQTEDARAVDQLQPQLRLLPRRQRFAQCFVSVDHLAENLRTLPLRRRQQQHQRSRSEQSRVQSQSADDGAFATLATAIE